MALDGMRCWDIDDSGMTLPERRIAELEAALREIEREAGKANADGEHDLLTFIEGTARDALRRPKQQ